MADSRNPTEVDLMTVRPQQNAAWEETAEGRVVLLRPKFRHPLFVRWLLPRLKSQNFRITLDDEGSYVWRACDGETTVSTIGERMHRDLGLSADSVYDRIGVFIWRLEKERFLIVHKQS